MVLDWKEYENISRKAIGEGIVLLKNEKNLLPLKAKTKVALFGRIQNHYYKSGTGSGGLVNTPKVWGILDALKLEDIELNASLLEAYAKFEEETPYNMGVGFGNEPWSQPEMPLTDELVAKVADESELALVIIGRTAGEEQDYVNAPGAYKLSEIEVDMIEKVRKSFDKFILIMNVSAVLDMTDIERVSPDAILYAWQGGEMGGLGTADVIMGRVAPSGHLTDTMVRNIEDAPAYNFFGKRDSNNYGEDIYVGYRYYETFNKEAVMYPFGYGLSYTDFELKVDGFDAENAEVKVAVTNIGAVAAKEVVQLYISQPQGALGKPALVLAGFDKTDIIAPGATATVSIKVDEYTYASYDETGKTGFKAAYVLEEGTYKFFVGKDIRTLIPAGERVVEKTKLLVQLTNQLQPNKEYDRMIPVCKDGKYEIGWEKVPTGPNTDREEAIADKPESLPYTGDKGIKLADVRAGKATMDEFIAQLSNEDLAAIIRGEGMGSPKVTPGTAAAFGGISASLKAFGIPCACCSDGPSGMRMDCGTRAFSLPNGTMLACTWNKDLNKELYSYLGLEMSKNNIDVLLGPGINIHRHPLNGRNFEYFSEDPLLTGVMAAAQINGMQTAGNTGTLKHFCANNQETNRHWLESVVSERALREIYLKGYEIAVKAGANSVMTTYGALNGIWTCGRHDLNTNVLRNEWGFEGVVMTDWWANIGDVGGEVNRTDFARMAMAQNDFYAVCPEAGVNSTGDNTLEELEAGRITRGQLARCAANICSFVMKTNAMKRLLGEAEKIELLNYQEDSSEVDPTSVPYFKVYDGATYDMSNAFTARGTSLVFGVDAEKLGCYYMEMTASSELSELAQINVAVFKTSIPGGIFGFRGTNGKDMTVRRKLLMSAKYGIIRLYFAGGGLKLKNIRFVYEKDLDKMNYEELSDYIYG